MSIFFVTVDGPSGTALPLSLSLFETGCPFTSIYRLRPELVERSRAETGLAWRPWVGKNGCSLRRRWEVSFQAQPSGVPRYLDTSFVNPLKN